MGWQPLLVYSNDKESRHPFHSEVTAMIGNSEAPSLCVDLLFVMHVCCVWHPFISCSGI